LSSIYMDIAIAAFVIEIENCPNEHVNLPGEKLSYLLSLATSGTAALKVTRYNIILHVEQGMIPVGILQPILAIEL
jgi:hypothetical protein